MPKFSSKGWSLDEIDKFILETLMKNANIKIKELCEITKLTIVPMSYRINKLKEAFVIGTYCRVNKKSLGYPFEVVFLVSINNPSKEIYDEFVCYIANIKEVRSADLVTGSCDYILRVVAKNPNHINELNLKLLECPYISKCQSFNILQTPLYREGVPIE